MNKSFQATLQRSRAVSAKVREAQKDLSKVDENYAKMRDLGKNLDGKKAFYARALAPLTLP